MPDPLEIFINEQRADLAFFRIVLHVFFARLIAADSARAEERLQEVKSTVMDVVGRMQVEPADQGTDRMKQMVSMRAEKFLADMEQLFLEARHKTGEAGRN